MEWLRQRRGPLAVAALALLIGLVCWFGNVAGAIGHAVMGPETDTVPHVIDIADKIFGSIGGVVSVIALAYAIWQGRRQSSAGPPATAARSLPAEKAGRAVRPFVNRHKQRRDLRSALWSRESRIILVQGPAGVGKTELVKRVLEHLLRFGTRIREWHAAPAFHPSIDMLTEAVEDAAGEVSEAGLRDESPLGRLEAALERLGRRRMIIVLDCAQHLLGPDRELRDLGLEEALDAIATKPDHGAKVVFISDVGPVPRADRAWVNDQFRIPVSGLDADYFLAFARRSGQGQPDRFASLSKHTQLELCSVFGGVPRLVQLFDGIVANSRSGITAPDLVARIRIWAADDGRATLYRRLLVTLVDELSDDLLEVYRAVAACGTAVEPKDVADLINSGPPRRTTLDVGTAEELLERLSPHALYRMGRTRLYYLPAAEAQQALEPEGEAADRDLFERAGNLLREKRSGSFGSGRVQAQAALAEVHAWLRAGEPLRAYLSIEELDTGVMPDELFRTVREQIATKLELPSKTVSNYNVLGRLHHARGDFPLAREHYRAALELSTPADPAYVKIELNLAWVAWAEGDVGEALRGFEKASNHALSDPQVIAAAQDGIARCLRRQGRFRTAVSTMRAAAEAVKDRFALWVPMALRLARLHLDIGDERAARLLVDRAREAIDAGRAPGTRAAHLDAIADLAVTDGKWDVAVDYGRQAVTLALRVNDPVTVLRARATICLARLHQGEFPRAAKEAALAERYRDMEQSLIVVAMRGLALRRCGRRDEAKTQFENLLRASALRPDPEDFAAREIEGVAYCAQHLDGNRPISDAEDAFRAGRPPLREPAARVTETLRFLVEVLAADDAERVRLRPALAVLDEEIPMPHGG